MRATAIVTACLLPLAVAGQSAWAADDEPSAVELHSASLHYLVESGQPGQALTEARSRPRHSELWPSSLLARALAELGMLEAAAGRYRGANNGNGSDPNRSQAWLRLAEGWYARGRYDAALDAVQRVYGQMPEAVARAAGPLEARILLAREDNAAAVEKLRDTLRRYDNPLARYNLGVALVRAGDNEQGAGELNELGQMDLQRRQTAGLRDKANLALAFGFLELGQGATARALFKRVRLDGPYSNRALLGLGWAELAPDGDPQTLATLRPIPCMEDPSRLLPDSLPVLRRMPREACGPPETFRERDRFEIDEGGATEEERYRRALAPWTELAGRTGGGLSIQEALVATAFAYAELGAEERALRGFDQAIERIEARNAAVEQVLTRLDEPTTGDEIATGDIDLDWLQRQWALPNGEYAAYLAPVVAGGDFRVSAQAMAGLATRARQLADDTDRLRSLSDTVDGYIESIERASGNVPQSLDNQRRRIKELMGRPDALRGRLDTTIASHDRYLRRLAQSAAREYKRYLETYMVQARRGRAGIHDAAESGGGRSKQ